MTNISDDFMKQMVASMKGYTAVILKKGTEYGRPDTMQVIWEHARRNFALRADGKLVIVCPINDESEVSGIGIFSTSIEETKEIMDNDPGVKEGIFTYEIHATKSLPGDKLS